MPLINSALTTHVDIGDDWYELRNELGFHDETIMLVDAVDPDDLKTFQLVDATNGLLKTKLTPGQMVARRNFIKIQAYLVNWSHSDLLIPENIKRIPTEDAKILREKIEELEASKSTPFRDEE